MKLRTGDLVALSETAEDYYRFSPDKREEVFGMGIVLSIIDDIVYVRWSGTADYDVTSEDFLRKIA